MRLDLLRKLTCPECGRGGLQAHALDTVDAGAEIVDGVLWHGDCGYAFPVAHGVASLLSLADADVRHWLPQLSAMVSALPPDVAPRAARTLERLKAGADTGVGRWNREEMEYYDAKADSAEERQRAVESMRTVPLWHIFLERERHLLARIDPPLKGDVLEVGAGNGRTIFWLRRPATSGYRYVGTDISFERLLLARAAMPEGDFVQCSAMNLPFMRASFDTVIAFGMMHHLPDMARGLREAGSRVASGGHLLLHEPISRPKLLPDGRLMWLRRLFSTYEHSAHDGEIDVDTALGTLRHLDMDVRHLHFSGSLPRSIGARLLALRGNGMSRRWMWAGLIAADQLFIKALCPRPNRLGPKAVFVVARRAPAQPAARP